MQHSPQKHLRDRLIRILLLVLVGFVATTSIASYCTREIRSQSFEQRLDEVPARIVARMTLEEKVGQLIHIGMVGKRPAGGVINNISKYRVGGVIHFAANFGTADEIRVLNNGLQQHSIATTGIPLLISTDQEGGRVYRVGADGVEQFPGAMALGQTGNELYAEDVGFITGYRLRNLGINFVLAPVVDVNNNPDNPVINTRSPGSDPELVSRIGVAYVRGMHDSLAIPVIKHFPGHGDTDVDSHLALPRINRTLEQLESTELKPFRAAIQDGGAEVVMSAHILFPALDTENPATLSPYILKELLRKQLHFDGIIISDAMEMDAISKRYSYAEAAVRAFQAGIDIILLTGEGPYIDQIYSSLLSAFQTGRLPIADLNRAVERQVELKLTSGLFHKWKAPFIEDPRVIPDVLAAANHFQQKEQNARNHLAAIERRYTEKGTNLNIQVSRDSITSLRKPFHGIEPDTRTHAVLLSSQSIMRAEARSMSISTERLLWKSNSNDIYALLRTRQKGQIWLVELSTYSDLQIWNRAISRINANAELSSKGAIIGLYSGNPFMEITIPTNGAVLASYSTTEESRKALVYRALSGHYVKQADLMLPD
ncbi:MAG: beta-glucosidase [Leptospiraceae bacterium]|nr:beta-glucosidase [Leptospiraceae bacterium]